MTEIGGVKELGGHDLGRVSSPDVEITGGVLERVLDSLYIE